ncbi:fba [Symbiodinium natans]|uniref:Fba protein n=1 Tax=Symbiodinium natans TaxID=878477 RepID=A0A812KNQ5_9DINO|nr:fba [Symbiodinium natans]
MRRTALVAAFDSAQSSALTDLECVRAAGAAAAAAAHAAGLTAEEQVRTAVLAAEAAAQKAGLLPEKEATAAAKAALAAAKATGLPAEEQAALAGRVVASVRQSLQKALAVKIQEIHQKTLAARATPAPTAKMSDAEAVAAAVAAARSAMDAAQAADAAAREAVATAVSANGTLNASFLPGAGPLAAATAGGGGGGGGPAGGPVGGPAGLSPGAPSAPTQGGEEPHLSAIEAILRKLSETVASYSSRIDASNSRLDKVEDVERALVRELGSARAGPRSSNFTGEASEEPSGVAEATEAQEIPFERPAKIPPHMNGTGKPRYWTHGNNGAAESVSQKPIHPHTQEDAILSTEEVLALGPDEVAQVLSHDRKLLATVTARLSSGKELADLVFGTDSSELPEGRPTEKALDAILNDPDVAKKAINLTMTTLHRGVSKLASGKSFADELFGSDTSRLIGEAFHPTEPPQPIEEAKPVTEAPRQAAPVTGRKVAGAGGAVLPPVPKAKEADKEEGRTTPAPEEKRGGLKMLGVEMPGLPSLPGLPVNLPDMPELPLQLPHVPNPLDWLR